MRFFNADTFRTIIIRNKIVSYIMKGQKEHVARKKKLRDALLQRDLILSAADRVALLIFRNNSAQPPPHKRNRTLPLGVYLRDVFPAPSSSSLLVAAAAVATPFLEISAFPPSLCVYA